jgi:hypothetical protein
MRSSLERVLVVLCSLFLTLCIIETLLRVTGLATDTPWAEGDRLLGFKLIANQTGTWEVDGDHKKLVLVMDTARAPIYEGIHPNTTTAFQYNKMIAETCQELSLYCLDLTDYFWKDFQRNKRRFNSVIDGHWNEYGHEVVAKAIKSYLLQNGLLPTK